MGNYVFRLPDVGEGIAEAEIVAWHVKVGDTVNEDAPLVDVMTDKATVEIGAPVAGKIVQRKGTEGQMSRVGDELVVIETEAGATPASARGEQPAAKAPSGTGAPGEGRSNGARRESGETASGKPQTAAQSQPQAVAVKPEPAPLAKAAAGSSAKPSPATSTARAEKVLASPAVRQRAASLGVELAAVTGSGEGGRVVHADLDAVLSRGRSPSTPRGPQPSGTTDEVEEVPVIGLRRQIAAAMQDSKRRIPHFSYVEEVDVTALEELRAALNQRHAGSRAKLTLLPFIITAMVRAVATHRGINAHYDDEAAIIHRYRNVHVGVATQTPRGLVVPVVRDAGSRDLWSIATEIERLTAAARAGKATREELTGSTITVSSLGRLGGIAATPIIKPPEVAIVGVNKMVERPVVMEGAVVVRKMMNLSSSFDHRVVDGFDAAEFIQTMKADLESPALLFLG